MTINDIRPAIVSLCQVAGINPARLAEIKDGCDVNRVRAILARELNDVTPGTLTLSDPAAAAKALDLAYSI